MSRPVDADPALRFRFNTLLTAMAVFIVTQASVVATNYKKL